MLTLHFGFPLSSIGTHHPISSSMECPRFAKDVTLSTAVAALITAKTVANCRPRYVDSLKSYLSAFIRGRETKEISSIDVFTIEAWFAGRKEGLSTMKSNVGRLSALFSFAERRGWIVSNPCKFLEKTKVDRKPPRILSVEESARLTEFVRTKKPHQLAFFALALYAGVRPEEIEKLSWDAIDFDRGICIVDAAASKVRRRRIVSLQPKALMLLNEGKKSGALLPVKRQTRRRYLSHACIALGLPSWPQDCLRHTAASYLLAQHQDAGKVAMWLGNSPRILLQHYIELAPKDHATEFFKIQSTCSSS
jgi:integrase